MVLDPGLKDLASKDWLLRIELLFQLFCTDNYQMLCRCLNEKKTGIGPALWDGYLMKLMHTKLFVPLWSGVLSKLTVNAIAVFWS